MKHVSLSFSLFLLALAVLVAACEPVESTTETEPMPGEVDSSFAFTGDFQGPLGLQLWSIRDSMEADVSGTLAKVHGMGFREVELAGTYGMSPEAFARELENAGLDATSIHASYDRLRDSLDAVLDEAETLGVRYVGVAWIPHPEGEPFTEARAREAAADFNAWGQAARERGLQFFYHTHGYEFRPAEDGTLPFDVLMQETDTTDVQYQMDVFWVAMPGEDPAALLREYPKRWALLHVKDLGADVETGDYSGHAPAETVVPVGTGQIDYGEVLRAAREVGVERYYIEDESPAPFENIPQSLEYLETVTFE